MSYRREIKTLVLLLLLLRGVKKFCSIAHIWKQIKLNSAEKFAC